jgi:predicted nucleotidyltransferase
MPAAVSERPVFLLEGKLGVSWTNLRACEQATEDALGKLRTALGTLSTGDASIVLFGSLARREFTADSDADWSLIVDGMADPQHLNSSLEIGKRIRELGIKQPGREGTFGQLTFSHDLIHYIGGEDDTNTNTTRRMLLLLESTPVGNADAYDRVVRNVLDRYLSEDYGWIHGRNPKGVPRFLQNDISRYWRTMAVDFAYKQRQRGGEGWALRSTKLRLSRKLIFAAGLLLCFSCALDPGIRSLSPSSPSRVQTVIEYLWKLSQQTPIDLMAETLLRYDSLNGAAMATCGAYDRFLGLLNDASAREHLEKLSYADAASDKIYETVRSLGHEFQTGLNQLFLSDNEAAIFELTKLYGVFLNGPDRLFYGCACERRDRHWSSNGARPET